MGKEWSVNTKTEWPLRREIPLGDLSKLQVDAKAVTVEDVMWCGELPTYDRSFDRLTIRTEVPMKRYEDLSFFNVTIGDDPLLEDMVKERTATESSPFLETAKKRQNLISNLSTSSCAQMSIASFLAAILKTHSFAASKH